MTIKELSKLNLFDENEQVVVIDEDGGVNNPIRIYTGRFSEMPEDIIDRKVTLVSAMGKSRIEKWNLNKYGWTEIWVENED